MNFKEMKRLLGLALTKQVDKICLLAKIVEIGLHKGEGAVHRTAI